MKPPWACVQWFGVGSSWWPASGRVMPLDRLRSSGESLSRPCLIHSRKDVRNGSAVATSIPSPLFVCREGVNVCALL